MKCAYCNTHLCYSEGLNCVGIDNSDEIMGNENMLVASTIEAEFYSERNRLEELIIFCNRRNFRKLGIAFCIGLAYEAQILHRILESKGFEVYSVCCKVGGVSKGDVGVINIHDDRFESICNPPLQAELLNDRNTDLNILVGLCIGHDIEFTAKSTAPVTTFIVKDRVLAHNPVGALYSRYIRNRIDKGDYK